MKQRKHADNPAETLAKPVLREWMDASFHIVKASVVVPLSCHLLFTPSPSLSPRGSTGKILSYQAVMAPCHPCLLCAALSCLPLPFTVSLSLACKILFTRVVMEVMRHLSSLLVVCCAGMSPSLGTDPSPLHPVSLSLTGKILFTQVVMEVMRQLEGAYALLFKSRHFPNELVACKRGSPLLLGVRVSEGGLGESGRVRGSELGQGIAFGRLA